MKMTRREKMIWSLLAGVLVLLFLLSSTDLIIKEKKTEIYPISIVIGDTTDDYYTNFRKGVDKSTTWMSTSSPCTKREMSRSRWSC